jgi:hypothetical protein
MNDPVSDLPSTAADNDVSLYQARSGLQSHVIQNSDIGPTNRSPLDISDCEFEDESLDESPVGETQFVDWGEHDSEPLPGTQPCPLDECRSLFSTLNQNVCTSVQSKLCIKKQMGKKRKKESTLSYSKQIRTAIKNDDPFANSDVAKRYLNARTNKRAAPIRIDQSVRGILVAPRTRRRR